MHRQGTELATSRSRVGRPTTALTEFVCGPKFTNFFSPNVGWVVVYQLPFRFSIYGSVSEIFAIKVESCQKSRRILDVFFALTNFRGRPSKNCTQRYHLWLATRRHVVWIKIYDEIPISSEVIDVHTLNFKPNSKFSRLIFLGAPVLVGEENQFSTYSSVARRQSKVAFVNL